MNDRPFAHAWLETPRLRMRPYRPDDFENFYLLGSDPDVMRYISNGVPRTREEAAGVFPKLVDHWNEHGFGVWVLEDRATGQYLGRCGLRFLPEGTGEIELLYTLMRHAWGRGIGTEAARESLRFAFDVLKLRRVIAIAEPANRASWRIMEKLGMKREKQAPYKGVDVVWYAIEPNDA
jgi:ribosomal-protein-alanine N-acetyltransferase